MAGEWNVRWPGSPNTAAKELARYKLDVLGVQEVRCDKRGHGKSRA